MSLLDERELTAEERAAIADESRPGVWIEGHVILTAEQNDGKPIVDRRGDGRELDQAQTDSAIAAALFRLARPAEQEEVLHTVMASFGGGERIEVNGAHVTVTDQRGGIHSDPLVRLLAFRAWGDRDRRWFDLRPSPGYWICRGCRNWFTAGTRKVVRETGYLCVTCERSLDDWACG